MSTISSTTTQSLSPKQRLLDSISAQVSAGRVSTNDQTALDSAVESIDDSLQGTGSASGGRSSRLDPAQMKSRIDDLIGAQVQNGSLTSSQADTLKQILAQGGGHGGHGGHVGRKGGDGDGDDGAGAMGAVGAPPAGPPPADDTAASPDAGAGSTTASGGGTTGGTTGGTSGAALSGDDAGSLLASFIKQLQDVQSRLGSYSATGQTGGSRSASAMLVNFEA